MTTLDEQIKPIGFARKQDLLEYKPVVPMYSAEPQAENGHKAVPLYSEDQVLELLRLRQVKAGQQAEPVAWGMPNTAITGKRHALMMVRLDVPGDDQYGGKKWIPLYATPQPASEAGWISVEERLPQECVTGLICYRSNRGKSVCLGHYQGLTGWWGDNLGYDGEPKQVEVTHWMPLPAAPESKK